jgi:hypothetical protein
LYGTSAPIPLPYQLDDEELQFGYFQQDGATAHTTRANLAYLERFYVDRIISRELNPEWPRSPDLTSLDFSVFGWLKDNIQCLFLTLAIGIYMLKSLGSVNELFSWNF